MFESNLQSVEVWFSDFVALHPKAWSTEMITIADCIFDANVNPVTLLGGAVRMSFPERGEIIWFLLLSFVCFCCLAKAAPAWSCIICGPTHTQRRGWFLRCCSGPIFSAIFLLSFFPSSFIRLFLLFPSSFHSHSFFLSIFSWPIIILSITVPILQILFYGATSNLQPSSNSTCLFVLPLPYIHCSV